MTSSSEQATLEVTELEILYGLTAAIARREPLAGVFERAFDALERIHVDSTPEAGTCFEILLPRRPNPEQAAAFLAPEA